MVYCTAVPLHNAMVILNTGSYSCPRADSNEKPRRPTTKTKCSAKTGDQIRSRVPTLTRIDTPPRTLCAHRHDCAPARGPPLPLCLPSERSNLAWLGGARSWWRTRARIWLRPVPAASNRRAASAAPRTPPPLQTAMNSHILVSQAPPQRRWIQSSCVKRSTLAAA